MVSRFILASASPRRAELLAAAGFDFDVAPADVDEAPRPEEPPRDYVLRIARAKADAVANLQNGARAVLAADTTVVVDGWLMGKPKDAREAAVMLRALSGRVHDVHTGVVVQTRTTHRAAIETTQVRFHPLADDEIAWYIETGEPMGKAGAYGIQGRAARFIERIEGSWSNVVGLPISTVYRLLNEVRISD